MKNREIEQLKLNFDFQIENLLVTISHQVSKIVTRDKEIQDLKLELRNAVSQNKGGKNRKKSKNFSKNFEIGDFRIFE